MSSFSRISLSVLNMAILIFGVYYIYFAENVNKNSSINPCLRQSVSSIQWIGVISLIISVIGIVGTCLKLKALQSLYLWAVLISTVAIIVFCVFIWAMMPKHTAEMTFYKTEDNNNGDGGWLKEYRPVMQKALANDKVLFAVKKCFKEIDTCRTMANQTEHQKVVFIDLGCCRPPNHCRLERGSTGRWVEPKHGLNSSDGECQMWARAGRDCFECDSCKAGYLGNYQSEWDKSMTSRIVCIIMIIMTSALAYYTLIDDHYCEEDNKDPNKLVRAHV